MDWEGQRHSEQIMQYFLLGSALVAFLAGYLVSSYRTMLFIFFVGIIVTFVFTVPDWSYFNRHPLEWAEPVSTDAPTSRLLKSRQLQAGPAKKPAKPAGKR